MWLVGPVTISLQIAKYTSNTKKILKYMKLVDYIKLYNIEMKERKYSQILIKK